MTVGKSLTKFVLILIIGISFLVGALYLVIGFSSGFFALDDDLSGQGSMVINGQAATVELAQLQKKMTATSIQIDNGTPQKKAILLETQEVLLEQKEILEEQISLSNNSKPIHPVPKPEEKALFQFFENMQLYSSEILAAKSDLATHQSIEAELSSGELELKKQSSTLENIIKILRKNADQLKQQSSHLNTFDEINNQLIAKQEEHNGIKRQQQLLGLQSSLNKEKIKLVELEIALFKSKLLQERAEAYNVFSDLAQSTYYRSIIALPQIILGILAFIVFIYIGKLVHYLIRRSGKTRKAHRALFDLIGTLSHIVIIFVGLLLSLMIVGLGTSFNTILAGLGVLGLALGLALQDVLKSFFAGIVISLEDPYDIGDHIQIGQYEGIVTSVQLRSTTVQSFDNEQVVIPNSIVLSDSIINISRLGVRRHSVNVGVAFSTDIEAARKISLDILEQHKEVLAEPEPKILAEKLKDSAVNLRLIFWTTPQFANHIIIKAEIIEQTLTRFREKGIEIPFPIRTIHLPGEPKTAPKTPKKKANSPKKKK